MTEPFEPKRQPLEMELSETEIAVIDRAASQRGRSRVQFVRDAALRAAEELLAGDRTIRMSDESFADFLSALADPATAVSEMVELLERAAPWESDSAKTVTR